jgi:dihydroorotate dehydrogenase (fumarate)
MADLSTTYMGIPLKNPIIAGASALTASLHSIERLEEAGVAALVTKSLFEEQIQLKHFKFDEDLVKYNDRSPEMITLGPRLEFGGPAEHLMWVKKAKAAVHIPVIASLNAVNRETWIDYAKRLEQTGVDGLECNFFALPKDPQRSAASLEDEQIELVRELKRAVSIPISLKLSFFYTNPENVVHRMAEAGADAVVLFNRLLEPDLDIDLEKHLSPFNFSYETDFRLPLRYAGLLEGTIGADICCSTGIFDGRTVVKMLLGGARTVQTVSAVFAQGYDQIRTMLGEVGKWMDAKGYRTLDDFRGKMSKRHSNNPWAYTRSQYVQLMMNPDEIINNFPAM